MSRQSLKHGKRYGGGGHRLGVEARGSMARRQSNGDLKISSLSPDAGAVPINPTYIIRNAINDALDPTKAPSKPKTFVTMTEQEKETMRKLYEKKP
jgi:hypothetical protein